MKRDAGFTLIETMIALGILLVVATGVLPLGLMAMNATENQAISSPAPSNTPRTSSSS
jgi:prepilin-type N-terminal cleavage/methylation domain-containing protein